MTNRQQDTQCADCEGTGKLDHTCQACDGNGWVDDPSDGGTMCCPNCGGDPCPSCNGTGEK